MRRLPTFEQPNWADALVHAALLLWSVVAAIYLLILVSGGESKAPESWSLGLAIVGGFYQLLSVAALAFLFGVRSVRELGQPMRFASVIGRGFLFAAPLAVVAFALAILTSPLLGWVMPFTYEMIVAPLVAVLGLPVMLKIGARWLKHPSAHSTTPTA